MLVQVHVQKGWEDGLFVTCVASCDDLWAIVMDAGTEYTQQIYKVHPNSFLPKEWIMEKVSWGSTWPVVVGLSARRIGSGMGNRHSVFTATLQGAKLRFISRCCSPNAPAMDFGYGVGGP